MADPGDGIPATEARPVDRLRQPHQFVLHVDDLIPPGAEQILLSRRSRGLDVAAPRFTAAKTE
ncbi:hypothetical protein [Mesorhizobium sp. M0800]|uniref:hypothetical protein n=1 Tax=Mesorhizobium sp. M0800 TaxID=2957000 RepID=UPI0033389511